MGGSALALLGNQRQTIDIDFVGDDVSPNQLHQTILRVAKELKISAEPVLLDRFVPLPKGSEERIIRIGHLAIWRFSLLTLTVLLSVSWIAAWIR